jgi:Flp pilus assembly protein TadB
MNEVANQGRVLIRDWRVVERRFERYRRLAVAVTAGLTIMLLPRLRLYVFPVAYVVWRVSHLALDCVLRRKLRSARRRANEDAPMAMDLLAACLASGGTLERGFTMLTTEGPPSWGGPGQAVVDAMRRGAAPAAALRGVAGVAGLWSVSGAASSIERSGHLGLPIAETLHHTAALQRVTTHAESMRRAGRSGPLATLITALVVAPSCVGFLAAMLIASVAARGWVH